MTMKRCLLLTSTLAVTLLLIGTALTRQPGEPPPRRGAGGPPPGPGQGPRGVPADDLVERVMAFDKNKDGKVTREELPERMHHLIEQGDTNKDGALDRDELRALAA